jgi:hypothetical protein
MKPRCLSDYVELAGQVRFLIHAEENWPVETPDGVLANVNGVLNSLEQLGFVVTAQSCSGLRAAVEDLKGEKLTAEAAARLRVEVRAIEGTLRAEAKTKFLFFVDQTQHAATFQDLQSIDVYFPEGRFAVLPEQVKSDLSGGMQCLLLQQPTPAAFHLHRAVERIARSWLMKHSKAANVAELPYRKVISQLSQRRSKDAQEIAAEITSLLHEFSNPADDPNGPDYSGERGRLLLARSCIIINKIHSMNA